MSIYRPWGKLPWVLDRLSQKEWQFLGTLGTEERSLGAFRALQNLNVLTEYGFIRVDDPVFARTAGIAADTDGRLTERTAEFLALGGSEQRIQPFELLCYERLILDHGIDLASRWENVILDASSMPKRFMFPILSILHGTPSVQNIVVTYTVPSSYSHPLAEDFEEAQPLPMCDPPFREPSGPIVVASVGYQLLRLPELIASTNAPPQSIKLLLPYPSPPPGNRRNWEIVQQLSNDIALDDNAIVRVGNYDVSEAFDRISALTSYGSAYSVLAPFGPKAFSIAMCLYATCKAAQGQPVPVYYTQPKVYHAYYSFGVSESRGEKQILSYVVRANGRDLYTVDGKY